jgi:hypothetical protein
MICGESGSCICEYDRRVNQGGYVVGKRVGF